jgi:predicted RNA binding protein YcfA (HicA-like mRNA interferase family)
VPRKIRELERLLIAAGFVSRKGRGSHVVWFHGSIDRIVVIAGRPGDDAKPYLVQQVMLALEDVARGN